MGLNFFYHFVGVVEVREVPDQERERVHIDLLDLGLSDLDKKYMRNL